MNAGAYGSQISDVLFDVTYIDENLEIKTITNKECKFGYRESIFAHNPSYIILGARFILEKGNLEEIEKKINKNRLLVIFW